MLLSYFTEEAYEKLLHDIEANASKYAGEDEWLSEYFGHSTDYFKQSKSVDVAHFNPYYLPGPKDDAQKTQEDLINTRALYDAFKGLTPLQASNKYMWTGVVHCKCSRKFPKNLLN